LGAQITAAVETVAKEKLAVRMEILFFPVKVFGRTRIKYLWVWCE
jgi:hypothetical protein